MSSEVDLARLTITAVDHLDLVHLELMKSVLKSTHVENKYKAFNLICESISACNQALSIITSFTSHPTRCASALELIEQINSR